MSTETLGQQIYDRLQKEQQPTTVGDLRPAMQQEYMTNLLQRVEDGKKTYEDDFFVVVITKREKILSSVLRDYFFHRRSCPTPDYDQAVYRYSKADDEVHFEWVIPSKQACLEILADPYALDSSQAALRDFVIQFQNGSLMRRAQILNNEPLIP